MRLKSVAGVLAAFTMLSSNAHAGTHNAGIADYRLPADTPVTVVLMRPTVSVGEFQVGGISEANADWTREARDNLAQAFRDELASRQINFRLMDERLSAPSACTEPVASAAVPASAADAPPTCGTATSTGIGREDTVAQYAALHSAVINALLAQKFGIGGDKLPSKKAGFRYTLGPQAKALGDISGANYGLFVETIDEFASGGRKAAQAIGALGCLIGACVIVHGGVHDAYVSLVDLHSGEIVWFNLARGSEGDVRKSDGAHSLAHAILAGMPSRPGEVVTAGNTH